MTGPLHGSRISGGLIHQPALVLYQPPVHELLWDQCNSIRDHRDNSDPQRSAVGGTSEPNQWCFPEGLHCIHPQQSINHRHFDPSSWYHLHIFWKTSQKTGLVFLSSLRYHLWLWGNRQIRSVLPQILAIRLSELKTCYTLLKGHSWAHFPPSGFILPFPKLAMLDSVPPSTGQEGWGTVEAPAWLTEQLRMSPQLSAWLCMGTGGSLQAIRRHKGVPFLPVCTSGNSEAFQSSPGSACRGWGSQPSVPSLEGISSGCPFLALSRAYLWTPNTTTGLGLLLHNILSRSILSHAHKN